MADNEDDWPEIKPVDHGLLWHYTDAKGLYGILKQGEIWASVIHYLNDGLEFQYALSFFKNRLRQLAAYGRLSEAEQSACELINERLLPTIRHVNVCVFSTSEEGDLLSQWRAYCPPDGGYTIGLSPGLLAAIAHPHGFRLVQCAYDRSDQRNAVDQLFLPLIVQLAAAAQSPKPLAPWREAVESVYLLAATLKHPSFSEEREWRLISGGRVFDELSHRAIDSLLIPYFRLRFAEGQPIGRIRIGPHRHAEIAKNAVRGVLAQAGLAGIIKVVRSTSPYRPL